MWFQNRSDTNLAVYKHKRWLEAGKFRFRKKRTCTICVARTKVLISLAVPLYSYMQSVGFLMMWLIWLTLDMVIKGFSFSTQLIIKFKLLIYTEIAKLY